MNKLTVKQLKDMMKNPIEVYTPTNKINCTSVKTTNDRAETVIVVYTK